MQHALYFARNVKGTKRWACLWRESFQDLTSNLPSCSWKSIWKHERDVQKNMKKQTLGVFLKDIYPLASLTHTVANYDHTVIFWTFTNYSKPCPLEQGAYNFRHTRFKDFLRGGQCFQRPSFNKKILFTFSYTQFTNIFHTSFHIIILMFTTLKHNHFIYQKIGQA